MTLTRVWTPSPNYSSRSGSVRLVVLHTAEGARTIQSLGSWFANPGAQVSSHVGIDDTPNTVGEYVKPGNKAWACAAYNSAAIQAELCAFAAWTTTDWAHHPTMLSNAARWVAEECAYFGIPITRLTPAQAQGGGRGICEHADLGAGGGGHWDCGTAFPIDQVIEIARGGTPDTPTPPPKPKEQEEDMVAAALGANGTLHVFRANGQNVGYTYKAKDSTAWNGGEKGKQVAKFTAFAQAPAKIIGMTAELGSGGSLNLWVDCADGNTYWTQQAKGESAWSGGEKGKRVAGLAVFAGA